MTIGLFTILLEFDWLLHDVFAFEIIEIYWLDFLVLRIIIGESGRYANRYAELVYTNSLCKRV